MRKKAIYIVVLLVVLAAALTIPNITFSKYVSESTDFDMTFSSASFYFDAEIDASHNYHGPATVLMYSVDSIDLTINVHNYVGAKVTEQDINYSIALEERDKEKFTLQDTERTLAYNGAKTTDSVTLTLSKNDVVTFAALEYVTIYVTSTEPFVQKIALQLGVYTQTYEEYNLTYEIHLGDNVLSTADEDFANKDIAGNTIDSIFGSGRLTKITNFSFYFTVTIPNNYTAQVYWNGVKIDVNGNWDLGADPVYEYIDDKIQPNTDKGPSTLKLDYTGYLNNAFQDYTISVYLTDKFTEENQKVPAFDARDWLTKAPGSKERGSTGIDRGPTFNKGNIDTLDAWDWTNRGTMRETPQPMTKQDDGTYSFVWTFQTNNKNGGFMLDALQMNGYNIKIPFATKVSVSKSGVVTEYPNADSIKTTVLPDGTQITVEYVRIFNNELQRVYTVTISNALSDITITGGNLMANDGSPEISIYSLVGIVDHAITLNRGTANELKYGESTIMVCSTTIFESLSFKLQDYYYKPTVKITDTDGNILKSFTPTLNKDGWYDIANFDPTVSAKLGLLYIEAEPMQFAIQYSKGEVEDATWDYLDGAWYDDNAGRYYTVENSRIFSISEYTPVDPSGEKRFVCWRIGFVKIQVGQIFDFSELVQYAVENEDGIFVITLEAIWDAG